MSLSTHYYPELDRHLADQENLKKQKEKNLATVLDILKSSTLEETEVSNILRVKEKRVHTFKNNTLYQGVLTGFIRASISPSSIEILFKGYIVYYKDNVYPSNGEPGKDCFVVNQEICVGSAEHINDVIWSEHRRIEDLIFKYFPKYTPMSMYNDYLCGCKLFDKMYKEMQEFKDLALEQYYFHMPYEEQKIYQILFESGVDRSHFTKEDDVIQADTNTGTYTVKLCFNPFRLEYKGTDTSERGMTAYIGSSPKDKEWAKALKVKFFHHYEKHRDIWRELGVL